MITNRKVYKSKLLTRYMKNEALQARTINENINIATKVIKSRGIPTFPLFSSLENMDEYIIRTSPVVEAINSAEPFKHYDAWKIAGKGNERKQHHSKATKYIGENTDLFDAMNYLKGQGIPVFPQPTVLENFEEYALRISSTVKTINSATHDALYNSFAVAAKMLKIYNPNDSAALDLIIKNS